MRVPRVAVLGVLGALGPCAPHRIAGSGAAWGARRALSMSALGANGPARHSALNAPSATSLPMSSCTAPNGVKRARTAAAPAAAAAAAATAEPSSAAAGGAAAPKYRKDYAPPPYTVRALHLDFALGAEETRVSSVLTMERVAGAPAGADMVLDGEDLTLESVSVGGVRLEPAQFSVGGSTLTIKGSALPDEPGPFELATVVTNRPRANTQLSGLYYSGSMLCTQCEAEGFRRITYSYDRPDVMSKFSVRMAGDKAAFPVLLSNGNLLKAGADEARDGAGTHFAEWEDPFLKPSYLFALVAGELEHISDSFRTMSGRTVTLNIYSEKENVDALGYAMDSLKRSMKWDEEAYGREYDLDLFNVVAVNDFNMGAMENKGLNIFNTACVLARPWSATDADYERVEGVVGHEYFHNWTGNRVTCRDWFQLTLKEGLTVYRDQSFSADMSSEAVKRISDVRMLRARQFPEDASPLAHPIRPESYVAMDNFYTATVYEKGAEVIRMYATLLGKAGFRKGMDLYFERHDGQAVTCDDFRAAMADATGRDLSQFEEWYKQKGTPTVAAEAKHDAAAKRFELTLTQSLGDGSAPPLHIPVEVALLKKAGGGEAAAARVCELTTKQQTFVWEGVEAEVVPSVLRGFSAPVHLKMERSDEELAFLMAHETDSFNRWEAAQQLMTRVMLQQAEQMVSSGGAAPSGSVSPLLVDGFRATLLQSGADRSLQALALALPDFDTLSSAVEVVHPQPLCAAISATKKALASALKPELLSVYSACAAEEAASGAYSPDPASIGRRRLRDVCLGYLAALDSAETTKLCTQQLADARCVTDALAAFVAASHTSGPERLAASDAFAARVQSDALGLDKWYRTRAAASVPTVLAEVRELMRLPTFSLTNPNRVRAVVGAFTMLNPKYFHAADGSGYEFAAQCVIDLDPINAQVAARLARAFSPWRRLEPKAGSLMRAQLERIRDHPGLSRNTLEIATTSLQ